jgi:HOOK protein coiled-coil region
LTEANKKIDNLQEHLNKKGKYNFHAASIVVILTDFETFILFYAELEMVGMEERYKKYIEKAKSVIKTLDPKQTPNAAPEVNLLRSQLVEKDRVIDELEKESEKSKV